MSMVTTIQLHENTLVLLKHMKQNAGAESYDELIRTLISKSQKPEKSLAGFLKGYGIDETNFMDGLRDEDDDD